MVKIRKDDTYIEIDENFSSDEIDTFEKLDDSFGDTSELFLNETFDFDVITKEESWVNRVQHMDAILKDLYLTVKESGKFLDRETIYKLKGDSNE